MQTHCCCCYLHLSLLHVSGVSMSRQTSTTGLYDLISSTSLVSKASQCTLEAIHDDASVVSPSPPPLGYTQPMTPQPPPPPISAHKHKAYMESIDIDEKNPLEEYPPVAVEDPLEGVCESPVEAGGEGTPALPNMATINNTATDMYHKVIAGVTRLQGHRQRLGRRGWAGRWSRRARHQHRWYHGPSHWHHTIVATCREWHKPELDTTHHTGNTVYHEVVQVCVYLPVCNYSHTLGCGHTNHGANVCVYQT